MLKVQVQAVKAVCAFILHHEKVIEIQKQFTDLLPNMLRVSLFKSISYLSNNNKMTCFISIDNK